MGVFKGRRNIWRIPHPYTIQHVIKIFATVKIRDIWNNYKITKPHVMMCK